MSNSTSTNTESYETWIWNLDRFCRENDYERKEAVDFLWDDSDEPLMRFWSRMARESRGHTMAPQGNRRIAS